MSQAFGSPSLGQVPLANGHTNQMSAETAAAAANAALYANSSMSGFHPQKTQSPMSQVPQPPAAMSEKNGLLHSLLSGSFNGQPQQVPDQTQANGSFNQPNLFSRDIAQSILASIQSQPEPKAESPEVC